MGSQNGNFVVPREFLAKALGQGFDIVQYKVKVGTKPGDNFTSLIFSAEIQGKNKSGKNVKKNLLLKCYPVHPSRQEFLINSNMFFKEMEIYRLWVPELRRFQLEVVGLKRPIKLPYVQFVYGNCVDYLAEKENTPSGKSISPLDNCIVLKDLRPAGYRMLNRRDPMDFEHISLAVRELAKLHSISWAYKCRVKKNVCKKFPCLESNLVTMTEDLVRQTITSFGTLMGPEHELTKALERFETIALTVHGVSAGLVDETILDSLLRIQNDGRFGKEDPNPVPWRVISHGDFWSNNMLFKYDTVTNKPTSVVFVDYQLAKEACIMLDLATAIYLCTDTEFRKRHIDDLLRVYVESFNTFCTIWGVSPLPGFNLESFRFRFHRYKLFGLLMACIGLSVILKEEEKAESQDMEDMDKNKNIIEMYNEMFRTSGNNTMYNERMIGLVQELYDEGVI